MAQGSNPTPVHLVLDDHSCSSPDQRKANETVLRLARLIGRQMAREEAGGGRVAAETPTSSD